MHPRNKVFIATSLDGYIADRNGGIDFLNELPIPHDAETGFTKFIAGVDALLMGKNTFETLMGFGDVEWPYPVPVFVLSNSMKEIPEKYDGKAFLVSGSLEEVLKDLHGKGYHHLYIDGGNLIQSFLQADLIDDLIITTIPTLLGGGIPLFGSLDELLRFDLKESTIYLDTLVQSHYTRVRVIAK